MNRTSLIKSFLRTHGKYWASKLLLPSSSSSSYIKPVNCFLFIYGNGLKVIIVDASVLILWQSIDWFVDYHVINYLC
jgi:hypothetical protein